MCCNYSLAVKGWSFSIKAPLSNCHTVWLTSLSVVVMMSEAVERKDSKWAWQWWVWHSRTSLLMFRENCRNYYCYI